MAILATACQPNADVAGQEDSSTTSTALSATSTSITSTTSVRSTTLETVVATTLPEPSFPESSFPEPSFVATTTAATAERLAHSYTPDCPVTPEQLVVIDLVHWGLDGEVHEGAIVVARSEAENVIHIFEELFDIGFPIASMSPIGDLPPGVEDSDPSYNNTSGLHCRRAVGSSRWSEHARGLAIDMNPLFNPYVSDSVLWPQSSERYVDRTLGEPGMIAEGGDVIAVFAEHGWQWGGHWRSLKDYHHFSVSGR